MRDLQDKVVLVTGGAVGIGAAVVRSAVAHGAQVAIIDRMAAAAAALAAEVGNARAYAADVADFAAMEEVCARIVADFGRLDGAVNNAGVGGEFAPVAACTLDNWNAVIAVNLTGVFYSMKAELAHMLPAGRGAIVNMASMAGLLAEANLPAYVASKHGVVGLTKSAAVDHGRDGIRCNAVCPAFVRSPLTEPLFANPDFVAMMNARQPMGRTVTAEEVAETTVFLLSDRAGGMTGSVHLLDGGIGAT
ncbi:SDR family oxidoreductase [Azospirillum sp.]|uniref:SDR family NAD(P)-dependent oxidoreductase n=1 Tax=Azospirillum sp. TaxID=34012 RepID=UPI0026086D88|nr:SDR family oxidoreductase [Azospirillum sp.]